ncbi:hypothetical protein ACFXKC_20475 [Streptomyces sp. NPDC059340]|uniref:hypothetical protein n=1 Tax=Streptomyces sp. NPDC059340 TaxID=3346806 RepID=UPI0036A69133
MPEPSSSHESRRHLGLLEARSWVLRLLRLRTTSTAHDPDHAVVQLSGEITSKNAER